MSTHTTDLVTLTGNVDNKGVSLRGRYFLHTVKPWRVARNRHPNTNGTDWGWIDGAGGDDTWSDDKPFNRRAAEFVASLHNNWLEAQKPLSLKLIEANAELTKAAHQLAEANLELDLAERRHRIALEAVDALELPASNPTEKDHG
jgi:hypothetical protein